MNTSLKTVGVSSQKPNFDLSGQAEEKVVSTEKLRKNIGFQEKSRKILHVLAKIQRKLFHKVRINPAKAVSALSFSYT